MSRALMICPKGEDSGDEEDQCPLCITLIRRIQGGVYL